MARRRNRQSRFPDAEAVSREALAYFQANFPAGHQRITEAELELGTAVLGQRRFVEAERLLLAAEAATRTGSPSPASILPLIRLYQSWGKPADAAPWQQRLVDASPDTQP